MMTQETILNLSVQSLRARLGGRLALSCRAGVWRCNGIPGPTLAGAIWGALHWMSDF